MEKLKLVSVREDDLSRYRYTGLLCKRRREKGALLRIYVHVKIYIVVAAQNSKDKIFDINVC